MPTQPPIHRIPHGSVASLECQEGPTEEEIKEKPWKYIGYKGYTNFISSDDDFFLLRRFDSLNVRAALALQDELSWLEEELGALDNEFSAKAADDYNNGTLRQDVPERLDLVRIISAKLREYNEFLIQQHTLRKLSTAPRRDVKSLRNWHHNHDYGAISEDEQRYLSHEKDLVAVAAREKTPLRQVIDGSLRLRTLSLWRHGEEKVATYDKKEVTYYSDKRMDSFASAVIIAIGVLMLITPIWILQALADLKAKLAVITVFIFVFLLVLSLAMVAKPFEALGATAAYAAVLMVFLQIQSGDS
ncbi:hypothetical protein JMJ77_0000393 [Colletotrichum scovillei]|uniref:DUF6594 domain-containing protein n=1 Tax=Colletotrichum scovillei TaxID=1209932 RepID=A0A9P7UE78_9PEZI|nr:hypothetical protein JMJ77_0000393 [Colletotrichum scovillei]KAG7071599.1 hypothetical protein JMJ76_0004470 [Colletotrichum scovillei]KAG7079876.1 hypothetical protein JMJ78_0006980 [Colletotrichum scovillei]